MLNLTVKLLKKNCPGFLVLVTANGLVSFIHDLDISAGISLQKFVLFHTYLKRKMENEATNVFVQVPIFVTILYIFWFIQFHSIF